MSEMEATGRAIRAEYAMFRRDNYGWPLVRGFDQFAKWLAEHDRQVKAEAWDEGHQERQECCGLCPATMCPWGGDGDGPTNPYREEAA